MTTAPRRLKDESNRLAAALADFADAPLPRVAPAVRARVLAPRPVPIGPLLGGVAALVAAAAIVWSMYQPWPDTAVRFSAPGASLTPRGAEPVAAAAFRTGSIDRARAGRGLLVLDEAHRRLALEAESDVTRTAADRFALNEGTLALAVRAATVVVVGDAEVRVREGRVELARAPLVVRAVDGDVEVVVGEKHIRLVAKETWPGDASLSRTLAGFVEGQSVPLFVEGDGEVEVDGVAVGPAPLELPLAPGRHEVHVGGQGVVVDVPATRRVRVPTPEAVLAQARDTHDLDAALAMLGGLERTSSAELALYERARRQLEGGRLTGALEDFTVHRARFPTGALAVEATLGRVDVLTRLARWPEALESATAFLVEHPDSERRAEVLVLRAELARRTGDVARARADLLEAATDARWADEADWRRCFLEPGWREAVARYLKTHPDGRHAAEARAALRAGP